MKHLFFLTLALAATLMVSAQVTSGPNPVGFRNLAFTDPSLADSTVSVRVFYPGTTAGLDAPVSGGLFPVVAFGHGFNMAFDDYNILLSHLASYGFIVITPDVQNGFSVSHLEFAREMGACINWMWQLSTDPGSEFYGRADTACGVFGHSMGGGASGLVHSVFPTIDAVSGLSAAETTPSAIAALASYGGAFQALSGSEDNVTPEPDHQQPMYNAATGSRHWVSITGGAHCKYSDGGTICDLVSGAGSITREEQIRLSKRYMTAFFRYHLQRDSSAMVFLCGDSTVADIAANAITVNTTFGCTLVTRIDPQSSDFEVFPNPTSDMITVRSRKCPEIILPDGREWKTRWTRNGDEWSTSLQLAPAGILMVRVPGSKSAVRLLRQ